MFKSFKKYETNETNNSLVFYWQQLKHLHKVLGLECSLELFFVCQHFLLCLLAHVCRCIMCKQLFLTVVILQSTFIDFCGPVQGNSMYTSNSMECCLWQKHVHNKCHLIMTFGSLCFQQTGQEAHHSVKLVFFLEENSHSSL